MLLRVFHKLQGAFKFLQNVEGKDLLIMELERIEERFESCRMMC